MCIRDSGTAYDLADAAATVNAYPGKLVQGYELENIDLKLELIFASGRTALIRTTIDNKTDEALELNLKQTGSIFDSYDAYGSPSGTDVYKRQFRDRNRLLSISLNALDWNRQIKTTISDLTTSVTSGATPIA